jgi:hypothetical protein
VLCFLLRPPLCFLFLLCPAARFFLVLPLRPLLYVAHLLCFMLGPSLCLAVCPATRLLHVVVV